MKRKNYIIPKFIGQNSNDPAEMIGVGECPVLENGIIEYGEFDGDQVGTAEIQTGLSHEPIVIHSWKSNDGYEYIISWGSDGIVNYYNKTSDAAAVVNLLTGMPVHFPPEFISYGNEYVIMLGGKYGNYKITSSGGTLTATATTTIPGAQFGYIYNGMLHLAQETSIIHSAPGDPTRFSPKKGENYSLDQRLILSSAGVMGETMGATIWKGYHILWTQYDCFIAAWDGGAQTYAAKLPGYGLYGLKSFTVLNDKVMFYSSYKQGAICSLVTGSAGSNGQTFSIGQNLQVSIIEEDGGTKVSDILRACPVPTSGKKIIAIDSQEDWKGSKIASATGFDFDTLPGFATLKGSAKITLTPTTAGQVINPGGHSLNEFMVLYDTSPNGSGICLDVDSAPGDYPATTPTPTAHVITADLESACWLGRIKSYYFQIMRPDGTYTYLSDKDTGSAYINTNTGWQSYILPESFLAIQVSLIIVGQYSLTNGTTKDIVIARNYTFPNGGAYNIEKLYIYNFAPSLQTGVAGASSTYTIGEVEIWGHQTSTGAITTAVLSQTGLAAGATDLGMFQIGYTGYNDDGTGGLTGATAPTAVEIGIGITNNPAQWGSAGATRSADVTTANGSMTYMTAAELLTGFKLSDLIRTGGGGGSVAFTFSAGGTLYVRARVPVTLQGATYASPVIDRLMWDFYTGAARVSTFPMFTWRQKVILSLLTAATSTECDKSIILNENGQCTVMKGVKWMAGYALPDITIVTAGKTYGSLGDGTDNLIFSGSASTDTPTVKTITTAKVKGINKLHARKIKFGVALYTIEASSDWSGSQGADITNYVPYHAISFT